MDGGVQRLHAPVQHLGEAGEVLDAASPRRPASRSARGGAARGDDLDAERREAVREVTSPVLSETEMSALRIWFTPSSTSITRAIPR